MEIRHHATGKCHELLVIGRVDGAGANQLETELLASIRAGADPIYVNLAQADFLCSAGVRAWLQYRRPMRNGGRTLLVTRPSPECQSVLRLTGFRDLIVEKV